LLKILALQGDYRYHYKDKNLQVARVEKPAKIKGITFLIIITSPMLLSKTIRLAAITEAMPPSGPE
jgi:hypothetical protein